MSDRARPTKCNNHAQRACDFQVNGKISLAPMLDVTDSEFRRFMRLLSNHTVNWTEMVVDNTVHNAQDLSFHLGHAEVEHPVVCQIGGSDLDGVGKAAGIVATWGYDEININCGCPSDRVASKGCFGAALMKEADLVAKLFESMTENCGKTPCTIKMRLGVDNLDSYEFVHDFVSKCVAVGCRHFIVHARKCWLKGLSPAKNRTVPPLRYDRIYRLARDFPDVKFTLNGGVASLDDAAALLKGTWRPEGYSEERGVEFKALDTLSSTHIWESGAEEMISELRGLRRSQQASQGVEVEEFPDLLEGIMIGRGAMNTIWMFADVDRRFYKSANPETAKNRRTVMEAWRDILKQEHPTPFGAHGVALRWVRPLLGLFGGLPGNKLLRQFLEKGLRTEVDSKPVWVMLDELLEQLDAEFEGLLDLPMFAADGTAGIQVAFDLLKKKNELQKELSRAAAGEEEEQHHE